MSITSSPLVAQYIKLVFKTAKKLENVCHFRNGCKIRNYLNITSFWRSQNDRPIFQCANNCYVFKKTQFQNPLKVVFSFDMKHPTYLWIYTKNTDIDIEIRRKHHLILFAILNNRGSLYFSFNLCLFYSKFLYFARQILHNHREWPLFRGKG